MRYVWLAVEPQSQTAYLLLPDADLTPETKTNSARSEIDLSAIRSVGNSSEARIFPLTRLFDSQVVLATIGPSHGIGATCHLKSESPHARRQPRPHTVRVGS